MIQVHLSIKELCHVQLVRLFEFHMCNNLTAIFQHSNKDPGTLTNVNKTSQNNCNKGLACKNGIVLFYKIFFIL